MALLKCVPETQIQIEAERKEGFLGGHVTLTPVILDPLILLS